jgi:hypothetical protein
MMSTEGMSQGERDELAERCNSVFLNKDSLDSALLAAGKSFLPRTALTLLYLQQVILFYPGQPRVTDGTYRTKFKNFRPKISFLILKRNTRRV